MNGRKGFLLFMSSGGMEFCWLYAWAVFLMNSLLRQPFPFRAAFTVFALASALTLLSGGRGWRIVSLLGLQVFGFLSSALRTLYLFFSFSHPFFNQSWLIEFYNRPRSPLEWFILALLLIWVLLFWIGGVTQARRAMIYPVLCTRFDWGLSAFLVLFLIKFFLVTKGEIEIDDPLSLPLFFSFFVFSLLSIGMARDQGLASKNFLPGYQGIGVILSFVFTLFLWGGCLVLFFLPYLTLASKVGASLLKTAAQPIGLALLGILRFIFFRNSVREDILASPKDGSPGNLGGPVEETWWSDLAEKILSWGLWGVAGLAVLVLSGLMVTLLLRWLFSRTSVRPWRQGLWELLSSWAQALKSLLVACWNRALHGRSIPRRASRLYRALLGWGRRSGLPHFQSETPAEYGSRLKHRFPALGKELEGIVEAFHQEVYGGRVLPPERWTALQSAWRRLRHPSQWPSRVKSRFSRPVDQTIRLS